MEGGEPGRRSVVSLSTEQVCVCVHRFMMVLWHVGACCGVGMKKIIVGVLFYLIFRWQQGGKSPEKNIGHREGMQRPHVRL